MREREQEQRVRVRYDEVGRPVRRAAHRRRKRASRLLLLLQAALTAVLMTMVLLLDMLPGRYVLALGAVMLVLWLISAISKSRVYALLMCALLTIGVCYAGKAQDVLSDLTEEPAVKVNTVSVIVMQGHPAQQLEDLDGSLIGIQESVDQANTEQALQDVKAVCVQGLVAIEYDSIAQQVDALYNGSVDAIILNEAYRGLAEDRYPQFSSETRVLQAFYYEEEIQTQYKAQTEVDVTQEPFTVFLSGNDSYGAVSLADGRTDVNILATVNPKTKQILLTTTPRDYYVELASGEGRGRMDKLTHAGLYGIDCSMQTLEQLYGVEIDYYVRLNFSGFQSIVDALGGVEVYSEQAFCSLGGFWFDEGYNDVNGEEALAFVRERYAFEEGDVQRGRNQMAMIRAILDRVMSPAILTNYMDLMDSLSACFITNMPQDAVAALVKMQLSDGASWNIVSYSVAGYEDMEPTYSGGSEWLFVMQPDEEAVQEARNRIERCLNGEILY